MLDNKIGTDGFTAEVLFDFPITPLFDAVNRNVLGVRKGAIGEFFTAVAFLNKPWRSAVVADEVVNGALGTVEEAIGAIGNTMLPIDEVEVELTKQNSDPFQYPFPW
jgi:hypothetical protein